jgi:microcystin-dependent protein
MAELIRAEGYNVTFISPGAPQYNGVVERMFATLYGMVRSMLNQAQVPLHIHHGVWAEAAKTATDMRNILVNYKSNKSTHEKFMGTKFEDLNLHTFGEMAIVEDHQWRGMRGKLTIVVDQECF